MAGDADTQNLKLAEAAIALLYHAPYTRVAGTVCGGVPCAAAIPAPRATQRAGAYVWPPFVPPPPSAVTTNSFTEMVKQRTRRAWRGRGARARARARARS
jgi:hypothetical protein